MQSNERWRPAVGYEGLYEVSDQGRVRSAVTGAIKAQQQSAYGYKWVALYPRPMRNRKVHRLVALAFLPSPTPEQTDVCHIDGNTANNHVSNLRWDTHAGNQAEMVRHGRAKNQNSDLTHCLRGHEFDAINTYWWKGARQCRPCRAIRTAARKAARKEPA